MPFSDYKTLPCCYATPARRFASNAERAEGKMDKLILENLPSARKPDLAVYAGIRRANVDVAAWGVMKSDMEWGGRERGEGGKKLGHADEISDAIMQ